MNMDNLLKYRSTIKSRPFLYKETKKMAALLLQGLNEIEIKEQVVKENIFQVNSEARKREISSVIIARLKPLDDLVLKKIVYGDMDTSKLLVIYTIIKSDRLFFEFMREVFSVKLSTLDAMLTDLDFTLFFENKKQQNDTVGSWKTYTFYKLEQVYTRILGEAGLLRKKDKQREIVYGIMDIDVRDHLIGIGDRVYIELLVGEVK
ncbi:DUF1819 domain-containing protein [Filibacter tadaridae]|uniref:Inner membrane protein (DUF1819) n=2 Tax=Filibacter tadaridae TaxID=2483811 RepID=A0A3P5W7H4_9BACL|nr:hypothetical protein FILTAD_00238 [Filibacter tadaridae]